MSVWSEYIGSFLVSLLWADYGISSSRKVWVDCYNIYLSSLLCLYLKPETINAWNLKRCYDAAVCTNKGYRERCIPIKCTLGYFPGTLPIPLLQLYMYMYTQVLRSCPPTLPWPADGSVIISHHYTIMLFLAHYNMLKKLAHYAFKKYPLCTTNFQLFSSNVMLDQLVLHMRCTWLILRSCWDDGEGRDLV